MDEKQAKDALEKDLKNYKKLERINKSDEFNDFFDAQVTTATLKMLSCFTGKGPQNWDEFCRIRGEVVGILYPIQQVRGAKVAQQQLRDQLDNIYNQEVE
jgi:hypothetical protein